MTPLTDTEAVELFNKGDERGFEWFWKNYYANLVFFSQKFMFKSLGYDYIEAGQIAKDMVCESFVRVFVKATAQEVKFKNYRIIKAYLYSSVRNAGYDYFKAEIKTKKLPPPIEVEQSLDIEHIIIESETYRQLGLSIESLPCECKKTMKLLYVQGKTPTEAAFLLKKSIHTIKNHRARAISIIRKRFPQITAEYQTLSLS